MRRRDWWLGLLLTGTAVHADPPPPATVASVDLRRYAGLWYEIAKIPNRFQRNCDSGTTAQYRLRDDGSVEVVNRCLQRDGRPMEARGVARVVDAASNSKLEVSFVRFLGLQLFWGDYWILGLADDYAYAVVGSPDRKYGWILGREPQLEAAKLEAAFGILRAQGFDPADFEMTRHEEHGRP